jgi:hypothetical protein
MSRDEGASWQAVYTCSVGTVDAMTWAGESLYVACAGTTLEAHRAGNFRPVSELAALRPVALAGTAGELWLAERTGRIWRWRERGIPEAAAPVPGSPRAMVFDRTHLIAATTAGIYAHEGILWRGLSGRTAYALALDLERLVVSGSFGTLIIEPARVLSITTRPTIAVAAAATLVWFTDGIEIQKRELPDTIGG